MALVLATVPKTGSHTMKALLGGVELGLGEGARLLRAAREGEHAVYFAHTFPENMEELRSLKGRVPIVAPMRHPLTVLQSWAKQTMAKRSGALPWGGLAGFIGSFERLFSLDPLLIPLDLGLLSKMNIMGLERVVGFPLPHEVPRENVNDTPGRELTSEERHAATAIALHPRLAALGYGATP